MAPTDALIAASPLATRMIEDVPMVISDDPDVRATLYAQAKLIELIDAQVEALRRNLFPQFADARGLLWWEAMLGLTINPPGLTIQDRRDIVLTFYRAAGIEGTGLGWEEAVTRVIGPGWYYTEHDPGKGSPDAYTVRLFLPFPVGAASYGRLQQLLTIISPANLVFETVSQSGFGLDVSGLDIDALG